MQDKAETKLQMLEKKAQEQQKARLAADEEWRHQQRERELARLRVEPLHPLHAVSHVSVKPLSCNFSLLSDCKCYTSVRPLLVMRQLKCMYNLLQTNVESIGIFLKCLSSCNTDASM